MDGNEERRIRHELEQALAVFETMQEDKPDDFTAEFAGAMRRLVAARNQAIAASRRAGAGPMLQQLNALTSVAASLEYPLAGIRWKRFDALRKSLQDLLGR